MKGDEARKVGRGKKQRLLYHIKKCGFLSSKEGGGFWRILGSYLHQLLKRFLVAT